MYLKQFRLWTANLRLFITYILCIFLSLYCNNCDLYIQGERIIVDDNNIRSMKSLDTIYSFF